MNDTLRRGLALLVIAVLIGLLWTEGGDVATILGLIGAVMVVVGLVRGPSRARSD